MKGNYAPLKNLHITLVFIGETDQVQDVIRAVKSVPVPELRISLDKLEMYGNILVAGVKGNQKLGKYVSDVRRSLDHAGIRYDAKKFSPHVTLVRKAGGDYKKVILPKASATVTHVALMKSVRKDNRMVYTEAAGFDPL